LPLPTLPRRLLEDHVGGCARQRIGLQTASFGRPEMFASVRDDLLVRLGRPIEGACEFRRGPIDGERTERAPVARTDEEVRGRCRFRLRPIDAFFELVSTNAMPSGIILSTYKVAGPLKTG
jgi:hypothetical protein